MNKLKLRPSLRNLTQLVCYPCCQDVHPRPNENHPRCSPPLCPFNAHENLSLRRQALLLYTFGPTILRSKPLRHSSHSDLHDGWDISFYQELTRPLHLPFGWSLSGVQPKILSSTLPSGDEGACMVLTSRLAPYTFSVQYPCPGALCLAELHLSGLLRILLISVYAQPPRRRELETALNKLFLRYTHWIMGGDFDAQVSH